MVPSGHLICSHPLLHSSPPLKDLVKASSQVFQVHLLARFHHQVPLSSLAVHVAWSTHSTAILMFVGLENLATVKSFLLTFSAARHQTPCCTMAETCRLYPECTHHHPAWCMGCLINYILATAVVDVQKCTRKTFSRGFPVLDAVQ